jgi:hypothetical protein
MAFSGPRDLWSARLDSFEDIAADAPNRLNEPVACGERAVRQKGAGATDAVSRLD